MIASTHRIAPELPAPLNVLRALRWISRAEGLLAELARDPLHDPDVLAVRDALADQLCIERRRLIECAGLIQSSSEKR